MSDWQIKVTSRCISGQLNIWATHKQRQ